MAATEAPWSSLRLLFYNDSAFNFKHSTRHPPVLLACTPQGPVYGFRPDGHGVCVLLERTEAPNEASAFLTFDVGQYDKKLIVWLWMKPEESAAEIKVGVIDTEIVFDETLLEKLAKAETKPEDIGLESELYWEFETEEGKRKLGIVADLKSQILEGSLADRWSYETPEVWLHIRDPVHYHNRMSTVADQTKEFKIAALPGQIKGNPVHENMSLAALIMAGVLPEGTTYDDVVGRFQMFPNQPATWEFLRGVMWNDDPACKLFKDHPNNNADFAWGLDWGGDYMFEFKTLSPDNITYRSHFGNLQFLHSMGCNPGEEPGETKRKIMLWLEVMYKLAVGQIAPYHRIDAWLGEFFNEHTWPKGSATFTALLMGTTSSFRGPRIDRRALGSCFHVIQDSYAVGHVQRHLENPEEQINVSLPKDFKRWIRFEDAPVIKGFGPGHCARFCCIQNFHCYQGQDADHHGHYDDIPNGETLNPSDIWSFNCIIGGLDGIKKSARLAEFWAKKQKWEDGVSKFLDEDVFRLNNASVSNTNIDCHFK